MCDGCVAYLLLLLLLPGCWVESADDHHHHHCRLVVVVVVVQTIALALGRRGGSVVLLPGCPGLMGMEETVNRERTVTQQ